MSSGDPNGSPVSELSWRRRSRLTLRRVCAADELAARGLEETGCSWELAPAEFSEGERVVVQLDEAIVAVASAASTRASIAWAPEPLEPLARWPWSVADSPNATVGCGLVMHRRLEPTQQAAIHRLVRTLRADELGHRYCIVTAPLPILAPHEPAAVLQQVMHGALHWPPLQIPLEDGYWPIGLDPRGRAAVCVRRNRAFPE